MARDQRRCERRVTKRVIADLAESTRLETSGVVVTCGAEEDVENDEGGADGDGGVGYVEGGIVVVAEADFEEVGDGAVEDAVGDVAGGAAEE